MTSSDVVLPSARRVETPHARLSVAGSSFSRALVQGLTAQQSDEEFNGMLDRSIDAIFQASST